VFMNAGYFEELSHWARVRAARGYKLESTYNGIATFVTLRRDDGVSGTGYSYGDTPEARDAAAKSARNLFADCLKHH